MWNKQIRNSDGESDKFPEIKSAEHSQKTQKSLEEESSEIGDWLRTKSGKFLDFWNKLEKQTILGLI
jgi:phage-related protein